MLTQPHCRDCGAPLTESVADLGTTPLANALVSPETATCTEPTYPLHAWVCTRCWLMQLDTVVPGERLFSDYAYFSSYSETWLRHAAAFADAMTARFGIGAGSRVVEIGSNDGHLLREFRRHGCSVLGIEPAANVAAVAVAQCVPTRIEFFGAASSRRVREDGPAQLIVANNVLAHVPDLRDFLGGVATLLAPDGVASFEFPHLLRLLEETQFDTIYHEHLSYLSLHVVRRALARAGLRVFDVAELPTHGGSLRVLACRGPATHAETGQVRRVLDLESAAGLEDVAIYRAFAQRIVSIRDALLRFLSDARDAGSRVLAYGAPAKGSTLLNYCGIGPELIPFTVDRSPHKQGKLLPGSRIPIRAPEMLLPARPDYVLILPWNLRDEIIEQMAAIRDWGGRFVVPIP
ncbi:MAG TPA: class I SAM-dependent methyltransferase, partial [Acetobacteraceae bacterium]|nr:class I SAM-dependent methyltransferase [Acetobacteraceae bacterium]